MFLLLDICSYPVKKEGGHSLHSLIQAMTQVCRYKYLTYKLASKYALLGFPTLGIPCNLRVASVTMPRVPSLPIKSRVMSYPAEDFLEPNKIKAIKLINRSVSIISTSCLELLKFIVHSTQLYSYLALEPVLTIVPSLNTAVKLSTFSLMLPYRTAVDPLQ